LKRVYEINQEAYIKSTTDGIDRLVKKLEELKEAWVMGEREPENRMISKKLMGELRLIEEENKKTHPEIWVEDYFNEEEENNDLEKV
jgi:hypothetical protein|tara:strand:+ start:215 stop:475 length:261 start_codon:yes stop_codon:yes gene_type:complete